jgi:solute carrier family 25 oxoglutarate transporter 11
MTYLNVEEISFFEKFYCSVTAGAIGSIIGNPMDLILVRFQSDTMQPPEKRRNYKHAGDAFMRIIREEGVLALWRGCTPTIVRAVLMNVGMLAPFDECKEFLNRMTNTKDTVSTRLM